MRMSHVQTSYFAAEPLRAPADTVSGSLSSPGFPEGIVRSTPERARRRAAQLFATCAMGAWAVLAIVPFVVVLLELA